MMKSYGFMVVLIACVHLCVSDALESAKCPSEEWQRKGSFCYRLTSLGYSKPGDAAADCMKMNGNATLANITSQQMQQDVSDVLGNRSSLTEIWVTGCFKTEDTEKKCRVLSNWIGWRKTQAYYRCFSKLCTFGGLSGVCVAAVDYVNQCSSSQCGTNSFNCTDRYRDVTCLCKDGFTGKRCETDIDECTSNPCQNEVRCVDAVNGYSCECKAGYTGDHCETDIDECHSNPCQHHGTCANHIDHYKCSCVEGTTGENCQTDIDDCDPSPCLHAGSCTDLLNGYNCSCAAGYTGTSCETDINECAISPCRNDGNCTDLVNGYSCSCPAGYTGVTCETEINECESNPCQNSGQCEDLVNAYLCKCVGEYAGTHCQTHAPRIDLLLAVKVAPPVVALLILIAIIVGVIFMKRRAANNPGTPSTSPPMGEDRLKKKKVPTATLR